MRLEAAIRLPTKLDSNGSWGVGDGGGACRGGDRKTAGSGFTGPHFLERNGFNHASKKFEGMAARIAESAHELVQSVGVGVFQAPAQGVDHRLTPRSADRRAQRRGTIAGQLRGQRDGQLRVLSVQMLAAEASAIPAISSNTGLTATGTP